MSQRHAHWFWTAFAAALILAVGAREWQEGRSTAHPRAVLPRTLQAEDDGRLTHTTLNTVRLSGPNPYAAAAAITQATYAATHHEDRPHAVTLVRADRQADAMLAASRITHFPVNSPILYVDQDSLPRETSEELERLGPGGNTYDAKVQVYLVGSISERVQQEIERRGYKTRAFRVADPLLLADELDAWAAAVHSDQSEEIAIVSYDQLDTGLPVVAWNAHMGQSLLFVQADAIPAATHRALGRRKRHGAFMYLFGDGTVISERVEADLSVYGHVQRVPGRDAYEVAVALAQYRDSGLERGYWLGWSEREFGWGVAEAGHNFTFANPSAWQTAVAGALLSHLGKHGPMLLVRADGLPAVAARYLETIRPSLGAPGQELSNHGWILGTTRMISWSVQAEIDAVLAPGDVGP